MVVTSSSVVECTSINEGPLKTQNVPGEQKLAPRDASQQEPHELLKAQEMRTFLAIRNDLPSEGFNFSDCLRAREALLH